MHIEAKELTKAYGGGDNQIIALNKASLKIAEGDFISFIGPSGSGKSTLLHLLSGLDRPTSGSLTYDGKEIYGLGDKELSAFRRQRIGFIFQQFHLLPVLTARENTLILIAIILSTMMTTVIGQSIGILNAMRENQAVGLNGNRYATLHQLTASQADAISGDSRLSYAERMISIGIADISGNKLGILLREYEGNALSAYSGDAQLASGRLPEQAGEIALPRDALSLLNYNGELGDTITLPIHIALMRDTAAAYEYSHDFILTGILKPNYVGYVSGTVTGIVGSGTAAALLPGRYQLYSVDIRTFDKKSFQNTMDDLIRTYSIPDHLVQYNDTLLSTLGIHYTDDAGAGAASGFSYMAIAGALVGALVLIAAGLVIYNILKIAVAKRIKEYGVLRAIGAERKNLYALVTLQLALLCGIGIPTWRYILLFLKMPTVRLWSRLSGKCVRQSGEHGCRMKIRTINCKKVMRRSGCLRGGLYCLSA